MRSSATRKRKSAPTSSAPEDEASFSKKNIKAVKGADDKDLKKFYSNKRFSVCPSVLEFKFNKKRLRMITHAKELRDGPVLYWMFRDQRVEDNWALLQAQKLALKQEVPFYVCFCLTKSYMDATSRQYNFMIEGLKEIERDLHDLNIPFFLLLGEPPTELAAFIQDRKIGALVTDFMPLRLPLQWLNTLAENVPKDLPVCQVDAHNVIPCWHASDKQEYAARTIRPKITNQLTNFLTEFPPVIKHTFNNASDLINVDWGKAKDFIEVEELKDPTWASPGTAAGLQELENFCKERLRYFATLRNDPTRPVLSNLSPWFHTGQLSPQRAALRVREFRSKCSDAVAAFLEESIVRRELADNFCFYNLDHYDSVEGAASWAQKTLSDHQGDKREKVYSKEQLENGKTHDDLWNAAQLQMVNEGKMHGFLRMYWAKKILEWTKSPEEALHIALYLNDKYELDGIDPNGYVGCMWSICGIHDQGWGERPVFGKIRYMNYKGCQRKFDVKNFVRKYVKK